MSPSEAPHYRLVPTYVLARATGLDISDSSIVEGLMQIATTAIRNDWSHQAEVVGHDATATSDDLTYAMLLWREQRTPYWTDDSTICDVNHHILVVLAFNGHIAITSSSHPLRDRITKAIRTNEFSAANLIPPSEIGSAFLSSGPVRSLWLAGTHRQVSIKSDSKALFGQDVRDVIDPLGDQSYMFTAARASHSETQLTIGASPARSAIWVAGAQDWHDYIDTTEKVLGHLATVPPSTAPPFPYLAQRAEDVPPASEAFDVSLLPPDLMQLPFFDPDDDPSQALDDLVIEHAGSHGDWIDVNISLRNKLLGQIEIRITRFFDNACIVEARVSQYSMFEGNGRLDQICELFERRDWVTVRYTNGTVLCQSALWHQHFADRPFESYIAHTFPDHDVAREKPVSWPEWTCDGGDSLFDWVVANPHLTGSSDQDALVICDDRSGEIADFLILSDLNTRPLLTLVHVKAANSNSAGRLVSVGAYELVASQALKNLRHLDPKLADLAMAEGSTERYAWRSGRRTTEQEARNHIQALDTNYDRKVIILQPHLQKSVLEKCRLNPDSNDAARLRQLDWLLLSASLDCSALNAEFEVIIDAN